MLTKNQSRALILVWAWAAFSMLSYTVVYSLNIQYDSRGLTGLFWWLSQCLFLPPWAVSEALNAMGISVIYRHAYVVIILSISIMISAVILFRMLNAPVDDDLR